MNTQHQNEARENETKSNGMLNQPAELLDLFAEELPTHHDLQMPHCVGSVSSASSFTGTAGTASTFSSL